MAILNPSKSTLVLHKFLPLFLGISLFLFTLGLSLFYIEGQFSLRSSSLANFLTIGSIILFTALLYVNKKFSRIEAKEAKNRQSTKPIYRRRWQRFTLVISLILGSSAFIGLSYYAANNLSMRWDVTETKQHTLSRSSMAFIASLQKEVELTAFYVGLPPKYLQDLFKEYERLSAGLITTTIVDPIDNISFAAKFGNVVSGNEHKVIVQSGGIRKDVDFSEEALSEQQLTHAIASATRAPRQVYFIEGHGENSLSNTNNLGLSTFKLLLANNNIHSKPLMLGITQSIPADCDVLIIAGPRSALTGQEDSLILDYLKAGGDALFLVEHTVVTPEDQPLTALQKTQNPSLNSIINHWGLNVESDIVVDLTNHVGADVGSPATKNYQKHEAITKDLDYTFYIRPRSIRTLAERRPSVKLAVIAATASTEKSWAETNRHLAINFDPNQDTLGPVPISYVVLEQHEETSAQKQNQQEIPYKIEAAEKISDTRIIIFTDADFLTNVYIDQYSNAQMGINVVNWLAELDDQVLLSAKKISVERLDLTSKQKRIVVVILFLIPFCLVIAGIIVWLRAKANK